MVARHGALALVLIASFLVAGCGAVAPTSVPATATRVTQEPTRSPLPTSVAAAPATVTAVPPTATAVTPTATVVPPAPTDTPLPSSTATRQPPTAVPPETPTPAPLLLLENSPQLFGRTETFQVGLGDLDGDGDPDAVLANMAANHSQVWFNGGGVQGGTPGEFTDSGQKLTQQGHGLGLGDLDGDGDLDILLTCAHYNPGGGWSKMPSRVYLNDGQGKFAESEQGLGDTELSGNGVNLIDLDGDGDLDAHVIYYEAADKVYVNDGLGRFSDSGLALEEEEIAWGDLDADGDVDMLAKAYGEGYRVLLNDGTGRFVAGWQVEDSQAIYGDLALADLDGDGDLDALDANGFRSEGSFPTRLLWNDGGVQGGTPGQFTDSGQELPKTMAARFALGDLDRDGDLDLYVSNMPPGSGEAWLNDGAGQLVDSGLRLESPSRHLATWPSLGDLDGDGDLDLVEAGFQGKAEVWLNRTALPDGSRANAWIRTFEGPDYGAFFDLVLTEDGNALAVGATNHLHFPPYSGDALLMNLTLEGDLLWERTWGGDGYEQAWSVALAGDGGYYVFGETDSYGAGDRDFFLLKIATDGSQDWFKTYGGARREWPFGMLRLSNGDLLLYGFTEPEDSSGRHQYALRVGPDGEVLWEYTVESPGEELVIDALETAAGDLILAIVVEEDGKLVKLDANGNALWTRRYELAGWQYASQIAETDEGGFLLAGFSMSNGTRRQADTWLAHSAPTGELEWETSFGDPAHDDYATSLIRLQDGTYLIGGIGNGLLLSRVDQDGNVLWRQSLVGETVYGSDGLVELADGGYLVAGFVQITNGRSYDAVLLRTDAPLSPRATSQAGATQTWEKDGSVMVYVPAGAFWMGSTSAEIADAVAACVAAGGSGPLCRRSFGAEVPRHEITLDAFWIDRIEVTNAQYRKCVEAGVCEEPATCYWGTPTYNDSSKADHPVVCVAWSDASTYCQWAGKRLPTEAEWEKAARGTDGLVFPWGDAFDGRLVNFCDLNCESERRNEDWDDGYADTAPVGSYADGESPYGAWDMAGNVWEWVSDWYDGTYYAGSPSSNPQGPDTGTDKVARGGSWYGLWSYARTATRRGHQPSDRGSIFGIRCAVEATSIAPPAAADTSLPPTTGSTQPPAPGDTWTRPADSMTMVYVLGGEFQMGSAADDPQTVSDELPAHTVTLDSFWIDQTEVTNAQFVQFLNEQGNSNVQGVPKIVLDEGYAQISQEGNRFVAREVSLDRPVVMVTWHGAAAYCQWAGGRLPTEAEWEYAARGPAGNPYPWGDAPPTCDLANHGTCVGVPQQTGSRPAGASWCGALDLAGSVWEWVADWYAPYTDRPQNNPTGPPSGDVPVLRGGGWHSPPWELRATYRQHDLWANGYNGCVGFRCVVTHQPERASVGLDSAQPACFTAARSSQPALDMRQGASVSFTLSARRL